MDKSIADLVTQEPERKKRKYTRRKTRARNARISAVDMSKIVDLSMKGLKRVEIAKIANCNVTTVDKILRDFAKTFKSLPEVEKFRQVKSEIFDAATLQVLKTATTPEKLDKATLNQCAYAIDVFNKASRLERNLSTANVSTAIQFTGIDPETD